jgi:hypothetical protein
VNDLSKLLAQNVAPRVQAELQHYLRGMFRGIVRGYLPQTWWFASEDGRATLFVDKEGLTRVTDGESGEPDVAITWTQKAFQVALTTGDRSKLPARTPIPTVEVHTSKGKAAYGQLRKRLGL